MPERRHRPNRIFGFSPEIGRSGRKGINLDVAIKIINGADNVVNVMATMSSAKNVLIYSFCGFATIF
jgi:hypothetical protein